MHGLGLQMNGRPDEIIKSHKAPIGDGLDHGWGPYSVQQGILEILTNQNPSSDGGPDEFGWLRCTYSATQTDTTSGIVTNAISSTDKKAGDYTELYCDIFIVNDGNFGGSDDVNTGFSANSSATSYFNVGQGKVETIERVVTTKASNSSYQNFCAIHWIVSGDKPLAGARFYIKNLRVTRIRPYNIWST